MSGSVPTVSTVGCRMIKFPVARDQRGNLTVIEGSGNGINPPLAGVVDTTVGATMGLNTST